LFVKLFEFEERQVSKKNLLKSSFFLFLKEPILGDSLFIAVLTNFFVFPCKLKIRLLMTGNQQSIIKREYFAWQT
jgi:hypothetical protein